MDITKLCRGCMKVVASWEKENFDTRAVEMFRFCTNIEINEGDRLPKQFCYDCIIKIESSYTFIKEAQNVNVTLKNIISRTETSVIVELENCSRLMQIPSEPKSHLKLTLPDYKLCSSVQNSKEQSLVENVKKNFDIQSDNDQYDDIITDISLKELPCNNNENMGKNDDVKEKVESCDGIKKNICPICRKGFTSRVWFAKHMEKEHSGHKYRCEHCDKTFSKQSQLTYHATTHSDERKFGCSICGKRFKRRKQLTVHTRTHSDERPFACDKCQMRFKLKSVLKCHMKVHDGQKQYLCSYCGWAFAQAGNLSVHMRRHTGARPHACGECGYRAGAAASVRRHARRHRADAAPLPCAHCCKRFHERSALARHTRTHTGERPYRCGECALSFADSWKRKAHLMRAHRLQLQQIPRLRRDGRPLHSLHHSSTSDAILTT